MEIWLNFIYIYNYYLLIDNKLGIRILLLLIIISHCS